MTPHHERRRILVVDDEEVVLQGLSATLEHEGYVVRTARTAHDALEEIANGAFCLLITDVKMPGMSGIDLVEHAGAVAPGMRVMVLSGYPSRAIADEVLERGAALFLVKPVGTLRLRESVRSLISAEGPA